jgi:hypothetical protein
MEPIMGLHQPSARAGGLRSDDSAYSGHINIFVTLSPTRNGQRDGWRIFSDNTPSAPSRMCWSSARERGVANLDGVSAVRLDFPSPSAE